MVPKTDPALSSGIWPETTDILPAFAAPQTKPMHKRVKTTYQILVKNAKKVFKMAPIIPSKAHPTKIFIIPKFFISFGNKAETIT